MPSFPCVTRLCAPDPTQRGHHLVGRNVYLRSSQGVRGTGVKWHLFQGNSGIKAFFRKTGEQRQYWVTKQKNNNLIFAKQGNKPIYFRGTREQVQSLPGRASYFIHCLVKKLEKYRYFL